MGIKREKRVGKGVLMQREMKSQWIGQPSTPKNLLIQTAEQTISERFEDQKFSNTKHM